MAGPLMARFETASRRLADTAFAPSTVLQQVNMPKDLVARYINLVFHGSIQTTFAAGSPAAPAESTIDTLITNIQLTVAGRLVKSVRPHMLHMQEILAFGQEGERRSSAGASAVTGDLPTADGGFSWGSTTQYTTVRESIVIPLEMVLANAGKQGTWLDLRGKNAELKFTTGAYASLDTTGATVTYANASFTIEAYVEEVLGVPDGQKFLDYKQTVAQDTVSAQATDRIWELQVGNAIAGIALYVKNGASPSVAADLGVTDIKVMTGTKIIKQTTFAAEQAKMRQLFGTNSPRVANKSRLDGYCYINLLSNDLDLSSAFDARGLNSVKLMYSTHASATYSLSLFIEQHDVALAP